MRVSSISVTVAPWILPPIGYAPVDLISVSRMTATDHFMWIMLLGGGAYMMASRARGSAVLTASGEVGSGTPPSGCGSSMIGGQVEQKMFRLSIASGCLLLVAMVGSGRRGLLAVVDGAGINATTFDSTALEAALPRKVAHRATMARSRAQRYFLSRVSTAFLAAKATPGPASVEIICVIPTGYVDEVDGLLAILARHSKREGGTWRTSVQTASRS